LNCTKVQRLENCADCKTGSAADGVGKTGFFELHEISTAAKLCVWGNAAYESIMHLVKQRIHF
jgi:hypothetical protein